MSIIKVLTLSALLLGLMPASGAIAAEAEQIGTILEIEGNAIITTEDGVTSSATVDSPVHLNDVIATEVGARAFVQLIDGSEFTLSENGTLKVDDYIYDPDNTPANKARYSVLRGAFLYTSGLVAKIDKPDVKVETPYGAIGIRGTQFWGGDIDDSYGILVNEGEVNVVTDAGEVALGKGQGTSLKARNIAPGEVKAWGKGKIDRAVAMISLKNPERVAQRIAARKELNQQILERRKVRIEKRGEIIERRRNGEQRPIRKWQQPQ